MPQDHAPPLHRHRGSPEVPRYRRPAAAAVLPDKAPHERLGRLEVPLLGECTAELGLGRPLSLEIDRQELRLRPGSGLRLTSRDLPEATVGALAVDLVQGLVRTDARALGPFFDGALTVALCSALRHLLGWRPGTSAFEALLRRGGPGRRRRLPLWARRPFARVDLRARPEARARVDLRGDGLRLTFRRPALLRVLGLGIQIITVRFLFATQRVEVETEGVGPIRRALIGLLARLATRWLRPRLPWAMQQPDYDLFADEGRRERLAALVERVRAGARRRAPAGDGYDEAHPLARGAGGREATRGGLFAPGKAAAFTALEALKVTAERPPERTRVILRVPLGPVSGLALATDRGGDVALVKRPDRLELAAPLGLYLFADQFPELAELRLLRVAVDLRDPAAARLELVADPPLGHGLHALVAGALRRHLLSRLPLDRLRSPAGARHLLWRLSLGKHRALVVDTDAGAEVSLHHRAEAVSLRAPAGLDVRFEGLPLPPATLKRITYHRESGRITADGAPVLGPFGQALLGELARARAAGLPAWLGLAARGGPTLDPAIARDFPARLAELPVPALGPLEIRMHPADVLRLEVRPSAIAAESERGIALVASALGLALVIRRARHDLHRRRLEVEATPPPGDYVEALGGLLIESLLLPWLRRALPLAPEVADDARWEVERAAHPPLLPDVGIKLSLPPGAAWIAGRTPEALEIATTAPLELLTRVGPLVAELTATRLAWRPRDGRVDLDTQPPAGPLAAELIARLVAAVVPARLREAVSERLELAPPGWPPPPPVLPVGARLVDHPLPVVGDLTVVLDPARVLDLTLRRDDLSVQFGEGAVIRLGGLGLQLRLRRIDVRFMPLTVEIDATPMAGELERELAAQVIRGLLGPVMRLFWPPGRARGRGGDALLAVDGGRLLGPLEVRAHAGGALRLAVDDEGVTLSSARGVFLVGPAVDWLPRIDLHRLRYRFQSGAVELGMGGVVEHHYHEFAAIGPLTERIAAHLVRVLVAPRLPTWTQRIGARVLPPLPELAPDPDRLTIWRAQLPGGFDLVDLRMDPADRLLLRASRRELRIASARGLALEVPALRLRVPFTDARYHMESGEIQIVGLGRVENAIAEAVLRRELARVDPTVATGDHEITLLGVLDRFPVDDDGRRVLFADRLVRVLFDPDTTIVAAVDPDGLQITAEPGLVVDGVVGLDYLVGGLRYSFADAAFHLEVARDSLIAGMMKRLVRGEGEAVLNSLLRPLLPRAMRTPGYALAADPNPSRTIAALLRALSLGALARRSAAA